MSMAMPFFVVRLSYAFLLIYRQEETWHSLTGPVAPYIVMALLMEYCVVLIYLYAGFKIRDLKEVSDTMPRQALEIKA